MSKPRVFVTRSIPEAGLGLIREATRVEIWRGDLPPPRAVLLDKARRHRRAALAERTRERMAVKAADNLLAGVRAEPLPDPVTG